MDELFSCRNCIHNCGQSLLIGQGPGFCLQHDSVIWDPAKTTCKYLHRKDLPVFVVDEGIREHAAEYAMFPRLVSLVTKTTIEQIRYSERLVWERNTFDPILHSLAQYYKVHPRWGLISAFGGGVDGRRSLAHSSLVRHYMDRCGTWTSSYRLVLGLLQEIDVQPHFDDRMLVDSDQESAGEAANEALWDVVFARLSALQEYGWHAGLEPLMWASDAMNGSLAEMSWSHLKQELASLRNVWVELIVDHAKAHDAFFPPPNQDSSNEYESEESI
ncbi:MAG TPA: hypothetical protein VKA15_17910 [Isosphaeraceae bacterium]|nr:hypothetical protein [Isosphaeraceae bacterium]